MHRYFDSEDQRKIYNLILKNPGVHLTKIATILNMKIIIVEQHLQSLEQHGAISSEMKEGYKRYHVEETKVGHQDKRTLETQKRIYTLIKQNPGLHLSKIAEKMNMRLSLAQYHLQNLERDNLITADDDKGYKRFYIEDSGLGTRDKQILSLLRRDTPLQIILYLLKNRIGKHKDILTYLNLSPSTLSYHLTKLVECNILEVQTYGEEKGYKIRDRREILRCLLNHLVIDGFKELWDDFKLG